MHLEEAVRAAPAQRLLLIRLRAIITAGCLRHCLAHLMLAEVGLDALRLLGRLDVVQTLPLELIQLQDRSDFVLLACPFFGGGCIDAKPS